MPPALNLQLLVLVATVLFLFLAAAAAFPPILSPADQALIEQAERLGRQVVERRAGPPPPAVGGTPPTAASATDGALRSPPRVTVFISWSLGESALADLFRRYAGRSEVRFVVRGLLPGERLGAGLRRWQRLWHDLPAPPWVELDPLAFRQYGVTAVPTMVLEDNGTVPARVRGLTAVDWLLDRRAGGDLGDHGPVQPIRETDLIEALQQRAATLDFTALRTRALARFWERTPWVELPVADVARTRRVDPTVTVAADLRTPDGQLIAAAGQRLNPLAWLPMQTWLVVFDPLAAGQVACAQRLAGNPLARPVRLVATRLDRTAGWDGLDRLETALAQPVFLLNAALRDRLQLERVPARVSAEGEQLLIEEVPPGDCGSDS